MIENNMNEEKIEIDSKDFKRGIRKEDRAIIKEILGKYEYSRNPIISLLQKADIRRRINPVIIATIRESKSIKQKDEIIERYVDALLIPESERKNSELPFGVDHSRELSHLKGRMDKMMNRAAKAIDGYKNVVVRGIKAEKKSFIAQLFEEKRLELGTPKKDDQTVTQTVQTTVDDVIKGKKTSEKSEAFRMGLNVNPGKSSSTTGDEELDEIFRNRDRAVVSNNNPNQGEPNSTSQKNDNAR